METDTLSLQQFQKLYLLYKFSSAGWPSPAYPLAAICLVKFSRRKTLNRCPPLSEKPLWIWASAKLAIQFKHRDTVNMASVAAHSFYLLIQLGWMTQTLFGLEGFITEVLLQPDRNHFQRWKPAFIFFGPLATRLFWIVFFWLSAIICLDLCWLSFCKSFFQMGTSFSVALVYNLYVVLAICFLNTISLK